jgi:hypothetical protein
MAEETKPEPPKYLSDFKGTIDEQRKAKCDFISKYGFDAFEKLILNSSKTVQR